jgi:hypothetical protein
MAAKTYGYVQNYVQDALDLQEETFITPDEFLTYAEEALKFCESEVHKLGIEDLYFETCAPIVLKANRSEFALPSNIFANKITRLVFNNGSEVYDVTRIRNQYRYSDLAITDQFSQSARYQYMLLNHDIRVGSRIRLTPRCQDVTPVISLTADMTLGSEVLTNVSSTAGLQVGQFMAGSGIPDNARIEDIGSTTVSLSAPCQTTQTGVSVSATGQLLTCWYIRDAKVPTGVNDLIDFPEFWNFIAQHMIVQCLSKELGNPRIAVEQAKLLAMKEQVIATLSNRVPDQDDRMEADTSSYQEQYLGDGL